MISLRSGLLLALLCGPASAQDWTEGTAARALEEPAHTILMDLIAQPDTALLPFETDGCSGGMSEAWQMAAAQFPEFAEAHQSLPPWQSCCVTHDRAYHNAGGATDPKASFDARAQADRTLEACVIATGTDRIDLLAQTYDVKPERVVAAYQGIGRAMYLSVRVGGAPCSGLSWRWGYGYPDCSLLTGAFD